MYRPNLKCGDRRPDTQVILCTVQCCYAVHWTDNKEYLYWILTPNERVLSFQVPVVCAKFRRNRLKIVTVRARTDRQTDRQTQRDHKDDLIICPIL